MKYFPDKLKTFFFAANNEITKKNIEKNNKSKTHNTQLLLLYGMLIGLLE
jgi:hypothetical protein